MSDRTLSVVDFVKHVNRAFHDNDQRHYDLPSDEGVIDELLSDRDRLRQFLTPDGRIARILVRSNLSGSQAMAGAIREIEARGRELLPEFRVFATGTFVMLNRTSDQIAGEQLLSVSIALVTIYLTLSALFGSLRVGFTALVPNLIPILFSSRLYGLARRRIESDDEPSGQRGVGIGRGQLRAIHRALPTGAG